MKLNLVPARTGLHWVREGLRVFWRMPLAFGGLFVMFLAAASVLSLIPFIGGVLAPALVPAATVGLMAATRQAVEGRFPLPATLLTAFRQSPRQTRAILILGAIYAGALLLIIIVAAAWLGDGPMTQLPQLMAKYGGNFTPELMADPALESATRALTRLLLVFCLLYAPLSVLLWHAPALVHWHGVPVGKSLFFSAVAILRNAPAYLMFALGWMAVGSAAWIVLLVVIAGMAGSIELAAAGMFPLALLIAAMFHASLWFTFRDSFAADDAPALSRPPPAN